MSNDTKRDLAQLAPMIAFTVSINVYVFWDVIVYLAGG